MIKPITVTIAVIKVTLMLPYVFGGIISLSLVVRISSLGIFILVSVYTKAYSENLSEAKVTYLPSSDKIASNLVI